MIIACEKCDTRFRIDAEKLGAIGRKVRCANCHHVWLQMPERLETIVEGHTQFHYESETSEQDTPPQTPLAEQRWDDFEDDFEEDEDIDGPVGPAIAAEEKLAELLRPHSRRRFDDLLGDIEDDEGNAAGPKIPRRRADIPSTNLPALPDEAHTSLRAIIAWAALAVTMISILTSLYIWREDISAKYQRAAQIYSTLGLIGTEKAAAIAPSEALQIHIEDHPAELRDGRLVADIAGEIINRADVRVPVPLLYGVLCDRSDQELLSWSFRANVTALEGLSSVSYETSVADIPETTAKLRILFDRDYRRLHDEGAACIE